MVNNAQSVRKLTTYEKIIYSVLYSEVMRQHINLGICQLHGEGSEVNVPMLNYTPPENVDVNAVMRIFGGKSQ